MTAAQFTFVHNYIIIGNTFSAAFQRNPVYHETVITGDPRRRQLREFIAQKLVLIYQKSRADGEITEEILIKHITDLKQTVSAAYGPHLADGQLRIGTCQKLINIYLKFCWCLIPDFPEPPHCPVDRIILQELQAPFNYLSWTQLDDINEYKSIINQIRGVANNGSIAKWELLAYNA